MLNPKKRIILTCLIIVSMVLLIGCNEETENSNELSNNSKEESVIQKENEDTKNDSEQKLKEKEAKEIEKIKEKKEPISVEITSKTSHPSDIYNGIYSEYTDLDLKIINNTEREVKAANLYIEVYDLFDDGLVSLEYKNSSLDIPAKGYTTDTKSWEINEFINENVVFYEEPIENLKFKIILDTIIYSDGEKEVLNEAVY